MTDTKVYFITGAARGMGTDIARAALDAGHLVVATARDADRVIKALGTHDRLVAVPLDITDVESVAAAVEAAIDRFGRIDVLVNNAGTFQAGYFEEISPGQFRQQMETNFFGPLNVTRAVLPIMRARRRGQVVTISSTAGFVAGEFVAAYASSKFALEGWMEALQIDLEPYGIDTTIVEPGFFRTDLLVEGSSTTWPELSIDDYRDRTAQTIEQWKGMNGKQGGDPAKLGAALISLLDLEHPPLRWVAGADAVDLLLGKTRTLVEQVEAHQELSSSLDHE